MQATSASAVGHCLKVGSWGFQADLQHPHHTGFYTRRYSNGEPAAIFVGALVSVKACSVLHAEGPCHDVPGAARALGHQDLLHAVLPALVCGSHDPGRSQLCLEG